MRTNTEIKGYIGTMQDGSTFFHDGKNVYRAAKGNVVDCDTGFLLGRWECSVPQWNAAMRINYAMPATNTKHDRLEDKAHE